MGRALLCSTKLSKKSPERFEFDTRNTTQSGAVRLGSLIDNAAALMSRKQRPGIWFQRSPLAPVC
jgi:hypothetical protein